MRVLARSGARELSHALMMQKTYFPNDTSCPTMTLIGDGGNWIWDTSTDDCS